MATGWFITGTDTGIGKTWVSAGLMHALREKGCTVAGMKPVASGSEQTADGLRNEDALLLQSNASQAFDYELVNPYTFEPAVAPHLAAADVHRDISFDRIERTYKALALQADAVIVEGVGGWLVPLGTDGTVADLAARLRLPVILVVGMRLGCINHALLTVEAIKTRSLHLAGWVANLVDPEMARVADNIGTLEQSIDAPLIGVTPHLQAHDSAQLAAALDPRPLRGLP